MKVALPSGALIECTVAEYKELMGEGIKVVAPPAAVEVAPVRRKYTKRSNYKRGDMVFANYPNGELINEMLKADGFGPIRPNVRVRKLNCSIHGEAPAYAGQSQCIFCHRSADRKRAEFKMKGQ